MSRHPDTCSDAVEQGSVAFSRRWLDRLDWTRERATVIRAMFEVRAHSQTGAVKPSRQVRYSGIAVLRGCSQ